MVRSVALSISAAHMLLNKLNFDFCILASA